MAIFGDRLQSSRVIGQVTLTKRHASRWLWRVLVWGLAGVAPVLAQTSTGAQTPSCGASTRDTRRTDRAGAASETCDAVARARKSARRQGEPPRRSRPDGGDPERRRCERLAIDPCGNAPGARPDLRRGLPAFGPVQRHSHCADDRSRHLERRVPGRRRVADEPSAPRGRHVRQCLHKVRTIAADGVLRPGRRFPKGRPHSLSAEHGEGRRPSGVPVYAGAERRPRTWLRRRAHRFGQRH